MHTLCNLRSRLDIFNEGKIMYYIYKNPNVEDQNQKSRFIMDKQGVKLKQEYNNETFTAYNKCRHYRRR